MAAKRKRMAARDTSVYRNADDEMRKVEQEMREFFRGQKKQGGK